MEYRGYFGEWRRLPCDVVLKRLREVLIHATALLKTEEGWNIVQQRHLRGGSFGFAEAFPQEEAKG